MKTNVLMFTLFACSAAAQTVPATCDLPREVDKYQLLRRLSLDLRGRAPSYAEYTALDAAQSVDPSTIKAFLATDDFRLTMRRYHEELFWPNVSNVRLNNTNAQLIAQALKTGGPPVSLLASNARANTYRGYPSVTTSTHGRQCGDFEQTQFDPAFPGQFRVDPAAATVFKEVQNGKTVTQEGYRLVHPYWDPVATNVINVCAFDAQETPSVVIGGRTVSCGDAGANKRRQCGCGLSTRTYV